MAILTSATTDAPPEEKKVSFLLSANYWATQQKTGAYRLEGEAKHSGKMWYLVSM